LFLISPLDHHGGDVTGALEQEESSSFVWVCREPFVTTSANPWAPPEEPGGDAVLERLEMMIEPSFGDIDLPRPAEVGAELPWLSGGRSAAIEPDFDTAGLPAPAAADTLHELAKAHVDAPTALGADVGPPAFVPGAPTPAALAPPSGAGAPSAPVGFPPPFEAAARTATDRTETSEAPPTQTAPEDATSWSTGSDGVADWSAPDAAFRSATPLPSPMAVRAVLEESLQRRAAEPPPRRMPLLIALALAAGVAVVAVVAAFVMVL
jgi:hypothetical protein